MHACRTPAAAVECAETVIELEGTPDDVGIASVPARRSDGRRQRVDLCVQLQVPHLPWGRITLWLRRPFGGDSWHLDATEAARLAEWLRTAAAYLSRPDGLGQVGVFGPGVAADRPWLVVETAAAPYVRVNRRRLCLRFDDDLVRESGGDGRLWFSRVGTARLEAALKEAVVYSEDHPPSVGPLTRSPG